MLRDGAIEAENTRRAAIIDAWQNLTAAGPTLSSAERTGVIRTARAAWAGTDSSVERTLLEDVGHWIALDAEGITAETVATYEAAGLDRFRYLEAVGVAGRLANIDFYTRGLGASLLEIPTGPDEPSTGRIVEDATLTNGWVPATADLFAISVLDALPSDAAAFRALHERFYVPFAQFMNGDYRDALHRTQIEWIAARTSYLNECFY